MQFHDLLYHDVLICFLERYIDPNGTRYDLGIVKSHYYDPRKWPLYPQTLKPYGHYIHGHYVHSTLYVNKNMLQCNITISHHHHPLRRRTADRAVVACMQWCHHHRHHHHHPCTTATTTARPPVHPRPRSHREE